MRKFLAGEPDDLAWMNSWLAMVSEAATQGRRFSRVRVVDVPMSDYNRFSHEVAKRNNAAGEDIRYLERGQAQAHGLPDHDFWLFDSRTVGLMRFDDADKFIGVELVDEPATVVQHNYWRDAAWHYAVPRGDFAPQ